MIVFGGAGLDEVANADIHILDMPTHEWTLGKSAGAVHARRNMACAASGDSFIAWGGNFLVYLYKAKMQRILQSPSSVPSNIGLLWTSRSFERPTWTPTTVWCYGRGQIRMDRR